MPKRVLIVANGFVNDAPRALPPEVRAFAGPGCEMHVIVPAHLSKLQSLCSDTDSSTADARVTLDRILQDMTALGLSATGQTAGEDQLQAIDDALADFHADAILLITHVPDQQNWRERQLITRVAQFGVPIESALITRDGNIAGALAPAIA